MAVLVLSPQNCLKNPLTSRQPSLSPLLIYTPKPEPNPSLSPCPNHKPKTNPNPEQARAQPNCRKQRKRRRPNNSNSPPARSTVQKLTVASNQPSGQVKILKRCGEKLTKVTKPGAPHQPSRTPKENRLSPKKIQEHRFFAGSCTSTASPPPSSLPMPSFLAR